MKCKVIYLDSDSKSTTNKTKILVFVGLHILEKEINRNTMSKQVMYEVR